MTGLSLTRAHADDLDAVRSLLQAAGLPTDDVTPALLDAVVVARDAEGLAGCIAAEPLPADGWALVRSLVVAPYARRRGLGGRLLQAAHDHAQADGRPHLALLTTTTAPFFVAHGYAPADRAGLPEGVRRHAQFASLCPSSAVCLVRHLAAPEAGASGRAEPPLSGALGANRRR